MKQTFSKHLIAIMLFTISVGFSACGSDDDNNELPTPSEKASTALAGTYKGTMTTYPGSKEFYDVILTVTEIKDGKVRITTDKGNVTPKEMVVKWNSDKYIMSASSDIGLLTYTMEEKVLDVGTNATQESDITLSFRGVKQ
ncbi:MAG: hypothetical protein QM660_05280 [Dysgonomonas sp.]